MGFGFKKKRERGTIFTSSQSLRPEEISILMYRHGTADVAQGSLTDADCLDYPLVP